MTREELLIACKSLQQLSLRLPEKRKKDSNEKRFASQPRFNS